ncbi:cell division ATP-binding protein FtsE [Roseisolibacter sp. H3M3-2]|uniref:cell division ATP-binding protein FtsE n=1 Tax=Roseisolibacter sp. H3M3-2 TaxID=3031323 RepID=UPI0023DBC7DC|nr:cell division ATP-binding protein FtsE [Roseisolibacter sp. H3M3-2]MDF1503406.1 cell division ATP-binding protein FtsE [Roseisolibacter sp. H3M3-2]
MLRYYNVVKEYPRTGVALHAVSFELQKGEFAFLTGPSGSGKSSLLKLAYAEERPTQGEVRVAGHSVSTARGKEVALLRRKLGVVFQDFRLLPDRSAEQNVAFALEVTGVPAATIRDRVARALAQVGLAAKGTSHPHELSGGEQQRVAIARAIVNRPLLLLADEPTGNLDDRAARGVFQLLREINASGTAVLMATHNLELVRRSDLRVLEMLRGRLVHDSAAAGASTPAADAVAAALGEVRRRETPDDAGGAP